MKKKNKTLQRQLLKANKVVTLQGQQTISGQIIARKRGLKNCIAEMANKNSDTHPTLLLGWAENHVRVIHQLYKLKNQLF